MPDLTIQPSEPAKIADTDQSPASLEVLGHTLANLGTVASAFQDRLRRHVTVAETTARNVAGEFAAALEAGDAFKTALHSAVEAIEGAISAHNDWLKVIAEASDHVQEHFDMHQRHLRTMTGDPQPKVSTGTGTNP